MTTDTAKLTTAAIRDILGEHREKMTVQLSKPDNAADFWNSLFSDFSYVIYKDDSKKWEQDVDEHQRIYLNNDFPKDVISIERLAYYFKAGGFPMLDGNESTADDLSLVNKSGRLLKRFNRFVKLSKGYDIDNATMGKLGDKLQYYVSRTESYTIDFHDCIDWDDGMYGHSGSCWWGQHGESRETFDNAGGWSIRFYDGIDDKRGIGRTWLVPMDDALVCFNSYGVERPNVSKIIKQVFAEHGVELHYHKCEVYNGQDSTIPYINGGTGFVLAESGHSYLSDDSIDVDMEVIKDNRYTCDCCGDRIDDGETYSGPDGDGTYCESCYNDRFSNCERCGETYDTDDVHEVTGHSRYSYLCDDCMEHVGAVKCESCDDYTVDYVIMQDSGNAYCEHCAEWESEFTCQCGAMFEYAMDDGQTCESCDWVYCAKCAEMVEDKQDHDSDVHPGDDSDESNNDGDSIPSDVLQAVEDTVNLCHAKNNHDLTQYTLKVYRLSNVPGLFVYDSHALDKSYDHEYHVVHNASGLAAGASDDLSKAIAYMQALGPLHDWTLGKDETLAAMSNGVGSRAGELRREIIGR
jgi:hypothetical protein